MEINDLDRIHKKTANLLFEVNEQINIPENKLFYNGQFYSGSLNPEILFIGYNPGYGSDEWQGRSIDKEALTQPFKLKSIKYVDEMGTKLADNINFLLSIIVDDSDKYLKEKVAETNFIHFNTPNIEIYNKCIKNLNKELKEKINSHFIDSLNELISLVKPKIIVIIGTTTFNELNKKLNFSNLEILEKNSSNNLICGRTILKANKDINVIVTKHLSVAVSDSQIGSMSSYIKEALKDN
jgi:hypothetical protein